MKTKVCKTCNRELPSNREFFNRYRDKNGKEHLRDVCRECAYKEKLQEEWKGDLLKCHYCGQYKTIDQFDINNEKRLRNGRDNRCKKCKSDLSKLNKLNYSNEQKLHHILLSRLLGAKQRATKKNIEFDITLEDLVDIYNKQKGLCAITGLKMTHDVLNGRTYTNMSLDRIDSQKGYIKDNIQLVCMVVNQMKSDLTYEELYFYCNKIVHSFNSRKWTKKK